MLNKKHPLLTTYPPAKTAELFVRDQCLSERIQKLSSDVSPPVVEARRSMHKVTLCVSVYTEKLSMHTCLQLCVQTFACSFSKNLVLLWVMWWFDVWFWNLVKLGVSGLQKLYNNASGLQWLLLMYDFRLKLQSSTSWGKVYINLSKLWRIHEIDTNEAIQSAIFKFYSLGVFKWNDFGIYFIHINKAIKYKCYKTKKILNIWQLLWFCDFFPCS